MAEAKRTTIDAGEVERFSALAAEWWNPERQIPPAAQVQSGPARLYPRPGGGALRPRPAMRPGRSRACASSTSAAAAACFASRWRGSAPKSSAPMRPPPTSRSRGCMPPKPASTIDYRATTAEELADAGEKFDVVLNMEVVEHVADVGLFIAALRRDGEARRHHVRRHHQPHAEGAGPGHHRRRIRAALAAARHPPVWQAGTPGRAGKGARATPA